MVVVLVVEDGVVVVVVVDESVPVPLLPEVSEPDVVLPEVPVDDVPHAGSELELPELEELSGSVTPEPLVPAEPDGEPASVPLGVVSSVPDVPDDELPDVLLSGMPPEVDESVPLVPLEASGMLPEPVLRSDAPLLDPLVSGVSVDAPVPEVP